MKNADVKIGSGQMFCLIFTSRVIVTLTYSINNAGHIMSNSDWLSVLLLIPALLIFSIPLFLMMRQNKSLSMTQRAWEISKPFGGAISILYSLYFIFVCVISLARFNSFVESTVQTARPFYYYPALIMIPVAYAAIKGIEAISRSGFIATVLGVTVFLGIIAALIPRFDTVNVITPLYDGWGKVINYSLTPISNTIEIVALLEIFPMVKGRFKTAFFTYVFSAPLFIIAVLLTIILTLGQYATLQAFPFYTAAGIAEIGSLKRLDAFQSAVWLIAVFIKVAFYTFLSYNCVRRIIPEKGRKIFIIAVCAAVAVFAALLSDNINDVSTLFRAKVLVFAFLFFTILMPMIIYTVYTIKSRGKRGKSLLNTAQ